MSNADRVVFGLIILALPLVFAIHYGGWVLKAVLMGVALVMATTICVVAWPIGAAAGVLEDSYMWWKARRA
jgi:hypothetical protein